MTAPRSRQLVLVVEDDPDDMLLIRRAFGKAGIPNPLLFLRDGDAAIAYLAGKGPYADRAAHPVPALLLLDLRLPRRPGLEVLRWLRADRGPLRRLPVVVFSASSDLADINLAFDLGANSYLVKPVSFEDLIALLRALDSYWLALNSCPELESPAAVADRSPEAP